MTLAGNAIAAANVGMTDLSKITTFLVAGLKSFRLEAEDSARILDVLFRVANTTAINLEGIGEAFLRSANTLNTAGASLEQSAALIASANESIQDPAKVGTALKTIASRLRGVTDAGELLPSLADDFARVGIEIQEADGSFRNIFDVFQDFSDIYKGLDELTRESLLEKLAGKRQKNILIGLLENFDVAESALKDALNSTGEVAEANEKFLDSLKGKTNQLKEAWGQLLTALSSSVAVKGIVDALKGFVVGLTFLINKLPIAIGLVTALSIAAFGLNPIFAGIALTIAAISQGVKLFGDSSEESAIKIAELRDNIKSMNSELLDLRGIKERTKAQENRLQILLKTIEAEKELLRIEEENASSDRNDKIAESYERIRDAIEENITLHQDLFFTGSTEDNKRIKGLKDNEEALKEQETALKSYQLELLKSLDILQEGTALYKDNEASLLIIEEALIAIEKEYTQGYGFALLKTTEDIEAQTFALTKQEQALNDVRRALDSSEEYENLSDALEQLTIDGFLTDDMLDALIETYGASIIQTGLAKDAFTEYVEKNRLNTLKEIERLETLAQAEINTAKVIIASRKAIDFLSEGQGENTLLTQANKAIKDAENNLVLLANERRQIESVDKAREESIKKSREKKTKEEYEAVDKLTLSLNKNKFAIDQQNKLLSRTTDLDNRIAINGRLTTLYAQQRDLLLEQQLALDEEAKSLVAGTKEYDAYIDEAFRLSLAIEDTTNSIFGLVDATNQIVKDGLNLGVEQSEEELIKLGEILNGVIQDKIDLEEENFKATKKASDAAIRDKEAELEALKEANDALKDKVKLEDLLSDLQDLKDRRSNILANKNKRLVKDAEVGFVQVVDTDALKDVNKDIADSEKVILDFRNDQAMQAAEDKLQNDIDALNETARIEEESYNTRVGELESFQNDISEKIEAGDIITIESVTTLNDTLETVESTSYTSRLTNLDGFISDYNSKIATLNVQKAEVEVLEDQIKAVEESIQRNTFQPIIPIRSGSTESSTTIGDRATVGGSGDTTTSTTTVNTMNVQTNEDSLERLIDNATGQSKLQQF
jgi:TP901 family phage tail tape measure protein